MSSRINKKQMKRRSAATVAAAVALAAISIPSTTNAFVPTAAVSPASPVATATSATQLQGTANGGEDHAQEASSRREVLGALFTGLVAGSSALMGSPEPASATYSAYTAREKDWEDRKKSGDVKISSARDLRNQLREIVPQNSENSKIFCPNGASAAVSPLMENKCGDRMATASVFGRTEDTVGNSIPGFTGGKYLGVGGSSSSVADLRGAMPSYKDVGATAGRANNQLMSR